MIPAFFSSAQMILLECHESPAHNLVMLTLYPNVDKVGNIHVSNIEYEIVSP